MTFNSPTEQSRYVLNKKSIKTSFETNVETPLTYINRPFDKRRLKSLIHWSFKILGDKKTIDLIEQLKIIGYKYATHAGLSICIDDLKIPKQKASLIFSTQKNLDQAEKDMRTGNLSTIEYVAQVLDRWNSTSELLKEEVIINFEKHDILNPVYMMAFSGARGNISQVRQLTGMRGLMADPNGQIINFPIQSNFREGMTLTEYMISCYGARKGVVDTALRTATSGYLTRRLVDVAHHVSIRIGDCGTFNGIVLSKLNVGEKLVLPLKDRLIGRILAQPIHDPNINLQSYRNQEIDHQLATRLCSIDQPILVRSPLTCGDGKYICQLCYGWSLALSRLVSVGESVGIIAAQSIGEPGTQLTMRTFHTGGVFSGAVADQTRAPFSGFIDFPEATPGLCVRTTSGQIVFLTKENGFFYLKNKMRRFKIIFKPYNLLFVKQNQWVKYNQPIAEGSVIQQLNQSQRAIQTVYSDLSGVLHVTPQKKLSKLTAHTLNNPDLSMLKKKGSKSLQHNYSEIMGSLGAFWILSAQRQRFFNPIKFIKPGDWVDRDSPLTLTNSIPFNQASCFPSFSLLSIGTSINVTDQKFKLKLNQNKIQKLNPLDKIEAQPFMYNSLVMQPTNASKEIKNKLPFLSNLAPTQFVNFFFVSTQIVTKRSERQQQKNLKLIDLTILNKSKPMKFLKPLVSKTGGELIKHYNFLTWQPHKKQNIFDNEFPVIQPLTKKLKKNKNKKVKRSSKKTKITSKKESSVFQKKPFFFLSQKIKKPPIKTNFINKYKLQSFVFPSKSGLNRTLAFVPLKKIKLNDFHRFLKPSVIQMGFFNNIFKNNQTNKFSFCMNFSRLNNDKKSVLLRFKTTKLFPWIIPYLLPLQTLRMKELSFKSNKKFFTFFSTSSTRLVSEFSTCVTKSNRKSVVLDSTFVTSKQKIDFFEKLFFNSLLLFTQWTKRFSQPFQEIKRSFRFLLNYSIYRQNWNNWKSFNFIKGKNTSPETLMMFWNILIQNYWAVVFEKKLRKHHLRQCKNLHQTRMFHFLKQTQYHNPLRFKPLFYLPQPKLTKSHIKMFVRNSLINTFSVSAMPLTVKSNFLTAVIIPDESRILSICFKDTPEQLKKVLKQTIKYNMRVKPTYSTPFLLQKFNEKAKKLKKTKKRKHQSQINQTKAIIQNIKQRSSFTKIKSAKPSKQKKPSLIISQVQLFTWLFTWQINCLTKQKNSLTAVYLYQLFRLVTQNLDQWIYLQNKLILMGQKTSQKRKFSIFFESNQNDEKLFTKQKIQVKPLNNSKILFFLKQKHTFQIKGLEELNIKSNFTSFIDHWIKNVQPVQYMSVKKHDANRKIMKSYLFYSSINANPLTRKKVPYFTLVSPKKDFSFNLNGVKKNFNYVEMWLLSYLTSFSEPNDSRHYETFQFLAPLLRNKLQSKVNLNGLFTEQWEQKRIKTKSNCFKQSKYETSFFKNWQEDIHLKTELSIFNQRNDSLLPNHLIKFDLTKPYVWFAQTAYELRTQRYINKTLNANSILISINAMILVNYLLFKDSIKLTTLDLVTLLRFQTNASVKNLNCNQLIKTETQRNKNQTNSKTTTKTKVNSNSLAFEKPEKLFNKKQLNEQLFQSSKNSFNQLKLQTKKIQRIYGWVYATNSNPSFYQNRVILVAKKDPYSFFEGYLTSQHSMNWNAKVIHYKPSYYDIWSSTLAILNQSIEPNQFLTLNLNSTPLFLPTFFKNYFYPYAEPLLQTSLNTKLAKETYNQLLHFYANSIYLTKCTNLKKSSKINSLNIYYRHVFLKKATLPLIQINNDALCASSFSLALNKNKDYNKIKRLLCLESHTLYWNPMSRYKPILLLETICYNPTRRVNQIKVKNQKDGKKKQKGFKTQLVSKNKDLNILFRQKKVMVLVQKAKELCITDAQLKQRFILQQRTNLNYFYKKALFNFDAKKVNVSNHSCLLTAMKSKPTMFYRTQFLKTVFTVYNNIWLPLKKTNIEENGSSSLALLETSNVAPLPQILKRTSKSSLDWFQYCEPNSSLFSYSFWLRYRYYTLFLSQYKNNYSVNIFKNDFSQYRAQSLCFIPSYLSSFPTCIMPFFKNNNRKLLNSLTCLYTKKNLKTINFKSFSDNPSFYYLYMRFERLPKKTRQKLIKPKHHVIYASIKKNFFSCNPTLNNNLNRSFLSNFKPKKSYKLSKRRKKQINKKLEQTIKLCKQKVKVLYAPTNVSRLNQKYTLMQGNFFYRPNYLIVIRLLNYWQKLWFKQKKFNTKKFKHLNELPTLALFNSSNLNQYNSFNAKIVSSEQGEILGLSTEFSNKALFKPNFKKQGILVRHASSSSQFNYNEKPGHNEYKSTNNYTNVAKQKVINQTHLISKTQSHPPVNYEPQPIFDQYYLTDHDLITYKLDLNHVQKPEPLNFYKQNGLKKKEQKPMGLNENSLFVSIGQYLSLTTPVVKHKSFSEPGQLLIILKNKMILRRAQNFLLTTGSQCYLHPGQFINHQAPLLKLIYKELKSEDIIQGIPKIDRLFEARAVHSGQTLASLLRAKFQTCLDQNVQAMVSNASILASNQAIKFIQHYTLDAIQTVYQSQGVVISDKHVEIIIKQMTSKVIITDGFNSGFLSGDLVEEELITRLNLYLRKINKPIHYEPTILGITQTSLKTTGFISAASFQETVNVLTQAAYFRKTDFLFGLKENVILGNLLPVGTGFLTTM